MLTVQCILGAMYRTGQENMNAMQTDGGREYNKAKRSDWLKNVPIETYSRIK